MLGGVIGSVTTFFAYKYDLLQTLSNWMIGDFSGVLRGRYELLWIVAALTLAATWPPTGSPSRAWAPISPPTWG